MPAGFFVLRTPLLPVGELLDWSAGLAAPAAAADSAQLAAAVAADARTLRARLRAIVERADVRESLFIASPSLEESLPVWLDQPESERGRKVERTLVRYFARMTARATPFGLFAGWSLGTISGVTDLQIGGRTSYRRHVRIDGNYLASLIAVLGNDAGLRRAVTYRPNTSVYRVGGQIRYAEACVTPTGGRLYQLAVVEPDEPLEATLARAKSGARVDELAQALVDDDVTRAEADEFVAQLIDSQLLVSDLEPQVTGAEPLVALVGTLRVAAAEHPDAVAVVQRLEQVQAALRALEAAPLGIAPAAYRTIADELAQLPATVDPARLLHVDLVKLAPDATIGGEPLAEIQRAVALLHRWSTPAQRIRRFREAFEQRYGARELPLAEVLDEELGIGFNRFDSATCDEAPLLEGLRFGKPRDSEARTGPFFAVLLEKLTAAARDGAEEIVLDEGDVTRVTKAAAESRRSDVPPPLPDSLAAWVSIAASGETGLADGDFRVLVHGVGGPSAVITLGRFCHIDERLTHEVRAHLAAEEARHPDALFAEVVHLPEGRLGNLTVRPQLRGWELVYLGRSGAPHERQIGLDDLLVSVRDGRVVLRSRRHQREVLPRLTTAHAFDQPRRLGTYRFLCALQSQDTAILGFHWGALEAAAYLPRVRVGRTVLALARWRLAAAELRPLIETTGAARFAHAQELRRAKRMPRWVAVADGDAVMPVDFDNVLSLDTFAQLAKGRADIVLTERFGHEGACVRGPDGTFVHELVVPMFASQGPQPAPRPPDRPPDNVRRRYAPGSEWLYAKLYTGEAMADAILRDVVAPVVSAARQHDAIDRWFFVRYGDPEWHIRLRLFGEPKRLRDEVLPLLERAVDGALAAGRVWRFQIDTYEREIERYGGGSGMLASEQLFCADSDAVLTMLDELDAGDAHARWRTTLLAMDQLLDDLGLSLPQKHRLLQSCSAGYHREFHADGPLARQIGDRFRAHRPELEALLDGDGLSPAIETALACRSEHIRAVADELRADATAGRLTVSILDLAGSYLHMHANRMLRAAARAQELVLYDFLERLYQGRLARSKVALRQATAGG